MTGARCAWRSEVTNHHGGFEMKQRQHHNAAWRGRPHPLMPARRPSARSSIKARYPPPSRCASAGGCLTWRGPQLERALAGEGLSWRGPQLERASAGEGLGWRGPQLEGASPGGGLSWRVPHLEGASAGEGLKGHGLDGLSIGPHPHDAAIREHGDAQMAHRAATAQDGAIKVVESIRAEAGSGKEGVPRQGRRREELGW